MSSLHPLSDPSVRERLLSEPEPLLNDPELMRALVEAADAARGGNVVDMRAVAMDRLETRLDRLEETHRQVIAAAYDNLSGTTLVNRAILALLDQVSFGDTLRTLAGPVADTLRVDSILLMLETKGDRDSATLGDLEDILAFVEEGFAANYAGTSAGGVARDVTLRQVPRGFAPVHGAAAEEIRSEACLMLDLGEGRMPGLLVLGSRDPQQFAAGQGHDLLTFFAGVIERTLRRHLA
ncbi:DUF484 family protein [Palleronia caenipelagi]|uniref:DUF484 family protein n=1 Tax=Palleronia caenipelagi TaxID=2489174 RepID=A0A547Q5I5_9RHOB|nr:DUF484 family protein [Palleronia caenipelagi]TRD21656.1 DUF484 family protein [Palleronia caenipelagi]